MTRRTQFQEAFKVALSMTLFFWLALWMNWDMPKYGALAIALISLDTTGASLQKGLLRVLGTTVGLAVGLVAIAWFSQDRWGNMVFLAAHLVVFTYFMLGSRYAYAWYVAAFLPPLIWSTTYMHADSAFHYALFRYLETTAGVVIYTVIGALLWPRNAGEQLNREGAELWTGIQRLFRFYRTQLAKGDLPAEATNLRANLAGAMSQMLATLDAAYGDTPSVIAQKRMWEVLRVNARALFDATELWAQSIDDFRRLDLPQPWLGPALDMLEKRFERIGELWQASQAPDDGADTGNDAPLLEPLALEVNDSALAGLPRFDRAAVMSFRQQMQILDRVSRELLSTLRVLAGLDPSRGVRVGAAQRDLYRPSPWQPERLLKALFPAVCFVVAYLFWIYFNPPTGPSIPNMSGTIGIAVVMSGLSPRTVWKLFVVIALGMWLVVAPVYFFVMPALETGSGLLALIFLMTFILAYLGGPIPIMKSIVLVLFVMMTGISNDRQAYSFLGLVYGAMMLFLVLGGVPVLQMLVSPSRPEQVLMRSLRRFFHGCARIAGAFSMYRPEDRVKGQQVRKRTYESMVLPAPGQMQAAEKSLEYGLFPDNTPEKVKRLVDSLQSISFKLQALEIAHRRMADHAPDLTKPFHTLANQLQERLQQIFETWARFKGVDPLDRERAALQEIARSLEQRLEAWEATGESSLPDDRVSQDIYSVLGGLRGLLGAMEEAQNALRRIHWDQWAEVRF